MNIWFLGFVVLLKEASLKLLCVKYYSPLDKCTLINIRIITNNILIY